MRNMHKYEEIFPDEFEAEMKRSPIISFSFAPVEYHGAHGGLGMDLLKGYDICLRAAEISGGDSLSRGSGGSCRGPACQKQG